MEELLPQLLRASLSPPAQSLEEACRKAGLDCGGARCVDCRLYQLCRDETRWVVTRRVRDAVRQFRHRL